MALFSDPAPRVFALPPGADFAKALVKGLKARLAGQPPEAMARVTLFLNAEGMRQRVTEAFVNAGTGYLPQMRLVTDLSTEAAFLGIPPAVPPLRRRLLLAQLIAALLDRDPDLAPRAALYDLADSLAALLDEMQGEGVSPEAVADLDVANHSAHWARTRAFMSIVAPLVSDPQAPDSQTRLARTIDGLADLWASKPPGPVIVAGSTGSRGTTLRLMRLVAALPQGALLLPGFDFDLPDHVWDGLADAMTAEDHPQYRFRRLFDMLDCRPRDVQPWLDRTAPDPARNRLISLALRPAPVTDQWLAEGAALPDLREATQGMTLIEAPSPRAEALSVALILRHAAEQGRRAALMTPDRNLARQVTAALDRWGIRPDDSAGRPLSLSAPGRLLRHLVRLMGRRLTAEALIVVLKHPLTASAGGRGPHLLLTRDLEMRLRRHGPAFPDAASLQAFADRKATPEARIWTDWLTALFAGLETVSTAPLADHLARLRSLAEGLAAGPGMMGSGALWQETAGEKARAVLDSLGAEADYGGDFSPADFASLIDALLSREVVREAAETHPLISIRGTIEARVQGVDLLVLGGLNDGSWPQLPPLDPWLNRRMRQDVGLLLPERRVGLSAHDFQQAAGAAEVILTRARRDAEAEAVPSRWLNRLTNLLSGLPQRHGPEALAEMRRKGADWLRLAALLDVPEERQLPAPRPSPRPPLATRPRELAVTGIEKLIRDPYAVYARNILRLYPMDPLHQAPDARLRGSALHSILEAFVRQRRLSESRAEARGRLMATAAQVLLEEAPWPAARMLWLARLDRVADSFLDADATGGTAVVIEDRGRVALAGLDFTLTAKPDRIDEMPDGRLHILDYKTGTPPSEKQIRHFAKQLLLEVAMAERGGFTKLGERDVAQATYVGLGSAPKTVELDLSNDAAGKAWEELHRLIARYRDPSQGYTARRAVEQTGFAGDYDHLARYGEWGLTDTPQPEDLE